MLLKSSSTSSVNKEASVSDLVQNAKGSKEIAQRRALSPGIVKPGSSHESKGLPMLPPNIDDEHHHIIGPMVHQFIYKPEIVDIPIKILFNDYLGVRPKEELHLTNWRVNQELFQIIATRCGERVTTLILANVVGLCTEMFAVLRGRMKQLKKLSLRGTIPINHDSAAVFCSFSQLTELDISGCKLSVDAFQVIEKTCQRLAVLCCHDCRGLDDYTLMQIGRGISRFRKLHSLDFSKATNFTDTGLTSVLTAGSRVITTLNLADTKRLSALALSGLRSKMTVLTSLNVARNHFSSSAFEWIAEGCRMLQNLNVTESPDFGDASLVVIGEQCPNLQKLNMAKCIKVTDFGIDQFMLKFQGRLRFLDLSNNLELSGAAMASLSRGGDDFVEIKLNGIGKILNPGLQQFWASAKKLEKFEMFADLRAATGHRITVLPHISDAILCACNYSQLRSLRIGGAVMVTDEGAIAMIKKCRSLHTLDISHCNKITNKTLTALAQYSKDLAHLDISILNHLTDAGVRTLCGGCTSLVELQLNGIRRLTDASLRLIPTLRRLETLSVRNCSDMTSAPFLVIVRQCRQLRTLDVSGLDQVHLDLVQRIARHCSNITSLNCQSCGVEPFKFATELRTTLPLITFDHGQLRTLPREKTVVQFNRYVMELRLEQLPAARTLSKFCTRVSVFVRARALAAAKQAALEVIVRVWGALMREKRRRRKQAKINRRMFAARRIARWNGRRWTSYLNRRRARLWRSEYRATRLLQRTYRGRMARKRARILRERYLDACMRFQAMSNRCIMLKSARLLKSKIVFIQSHIRRFGRRLNYLWFRTAMIKLQRRYRRWRVKDRIRQVISINTDNKLQGQIEAVNVIKWTWRAIKFNKMISSFVLMCAAYASAGQAELDWKVTSIQQRWRGYWTRKHLALGFIRCPFVGGQYRTTYVMARRIQAMVRGVLGRISNVRFLARRRRAHALWRRAVRPLRPRLILGSFTNKIQRPYRRRLQRRFIWDKVVTIQCMFRKTKSRMVYREHYIAMLHRMSRKISYCFRFVLACRNRYRWRCRRHMAAWKIQSEVRRRLFDFNTRRRIHLETVKNRNKRAAAEKLSMMDERKERISRVNRGNMIIAEMRLRKIQRMWRAHFEVKRRKKQEAREMTRLLQEQIRLKEEKKKAHDQDKFNLKKNGIVNVLLNAAQDVSETELAQHVIKRVKGIINQALDPKELVTPLERARIINGIIKHQSLMIVQEGIVAMKITMGPQEALAFATQNELDRKRRRAYYTVIPRDLSGPIGDEVYLWYMEGKGTDCICKFTIKPKPPKISKNRMMDIEREALKEGFQLAWSQNLSFVLHGHRTLYQKLGGSACQRVEVAVNEEEEASFEEEGLLLISQLEVFGYPTSIWYEAHVAPPDSELFKYNRIKAYNWSDNRLLRCIEVFALTEDDVHELRRVFEKLPKDKSVNPLAMSGADLSATLGAMRIDAKAQKASAADGGSSYIDDDDDVMDRIQVSDDVKTIDCFQKYYGLYPSAFHNYLVKVCGGRAHDGSYLNFSEYVNIVCYLNMMGTPDLKKLCFNCADDDNSSYITQDEFDALNEICASGTSRAFIWNKQFKKYASQAGPNLPYHMTMMQYVEFVSHNMSVVWPLAAIQLALREANLGVEYWENKVEQFRVVRLEEGLRLIDPLIPHYELDSDEKLAEKQAKIAEQKRKDTEKQEAAEAKKKQERDDAEAGHGPTKSKGASPHKK